MSCPGFMKELRGCVSLERAQYQANGGDGGSDRGLTIISVFGEVARVVSGAMSMRGEYLVTG